MPSRSRCVPPFAVVLMVAVGTGAAPADDKGAVKDRLFEAKKEYDGEVRKFRQTVAEALDKREEAARKAGDKKALDQVKTVRNRFEKTGEVPADTSRALLAQITAARTKLDKAYSAAVKDLVKLKEDAGAETAEKELQKFRLESAALFGKRTPLATLRHTNVKVHADRFSNNGTMVGFKLTLDGEPAPYSLYTHPPQNGPAEVKYVLGGKWSALRTTVGVPTWQEGQRGPVSALKFEILGDGKSLWTSEPVKKLDQFQTCVVGVEGVKVLTLRVSLDGRNDLCRAVWFDPMLVE